MEQLVVQVSAETLLLTLGTLWVLSVIGAILSVALALRNVATALERNAQAWDTCEQCQERDHAAGEHDKEQWE